MRSAAAFSRGYPRLPQLPGGPLGTWLQVMHRRLELFWLGCSQVRCWWWLKGTCHCSRGVRGCQCGRKQHGSRVRLPPAHMPSRLQSLVHAHRIVRVHLLFSLHMLPYKLRQSVKLRNTSTSLVGGPTQARA